MRRRKTLIRRFCAGLILALLVSCLLPNTVRQTEAASGIRIYNNNTKQTTIYTGKQVKYQSNTRTVSMEMPGIIIDNIALASYEELFQSELGLQCTYQSSSGRISISDGEHTISMQLGSKTATVDGKTLSMPVAPVKLRFVDYGIEKIYVPTRFISEHLGYSYVWVSTSATAKITKTLSLSLDGTSYYYNSALYRVRVEEELLDLGHLPAFSYHGVVLGRAKKIFETAGCSFSQSDTGLVISVGDLSFSMNFGSKTAYLNGKKLILAEAAYLAKNEEKNVSYAVVPLEAVAELLGFELSYTETEQVFSLHKTSKTGSAVLTESVGIVESSASSADVEKDSLLFQWESKVAFEPVLEEASACVHTISTEQTENTYAFLGLARYWKQFQTGAETFFFETDGQFSYVESEQDDTGAIRVSVHHAGTLNAGIVNVGLPLVNNYSISLDPDNTVDLKFQVNSKNLRYSLSLLDENRTLCVTVYPNFLTKVSGHRQKNSDVIVLYGVQKEDLSLIEDNGMLHLTLPTTTNCTEDQFYQNTESRYLQYCLINQMTEGTRITVLMNAGQKYYLYSDPEYVSVHFTDQETEETDQGILFSTDSDMTASLPDDRLVIPLPDGITPAQVSDQDNYLSSNFVLSIKGNHVSFFKNNPPSNPYAMITGSSVYYNSSTDTTNLSFDTKLICAYQYEFFNGYLIVNVARPNELYSKIVVLDAGHGGIDPGASRNKMKEKDLNYTILNQMAKAYFENSGIKVYYTRLSDVKIDLYKRADFASEVCADFFISLHMNANNSTSVKGTQVYYSTSNNRKNAAGLNSMALAKTLVNNLSAALGTKNRGISTADFVVVKYNSVPAVLIELGFMTNEAELKNLSDPVFQKKAAKTIYDTVVQLFDAYPTGR